MSRSIEKKMAVAAQKQAKTSQKAAKNARKQAKRQQKVDKRAVISVHKRPIVCPPDKAGRSLLFRLMGFICRTLVVWLASAGLVTFVSAALDLGVSYIAIFLTTFVVVALVAMALYDRIGAIISSVAAVGGAAVIFLTRPGIIMDIFYGILSIYNAALQRLYNIGYLAYVRYQVPFTSSTPTEELLTVGICFLCVIVGLVFAFSLIKRVRIIPPAILATTFLVVILTFNIYSNRIQSNLGIVLVIVSFATVLVMAAYDRLYHVKNEKRYDTGMNLFGDSDRPSYPAGYMTKAEKKAARKADKKIPAEAAKAVEATKAPKTEGQPDEKTVKKKPSPAEIKQKKEEKRAFRRQVNAVKKYDRITAQSRAAMGGFASAAAMLLALLIIAAPAFIVKGNFETISAIDEKMSYARDYVTALLRGDDARLDELEYGADKNNFKPHSTDLEQLQFTGKQIFYVESRYNTNYYLRGWIGTDYNDGAWQAVNKTTLEKYRQMFDTSRSPGEEFRYQFYHYMMPSLVDDPNYTEDYLNKYQSNLPYGFVNALVSLRRVNSPSTLTYFPSTYKSVEGMFDYGTTTLSETTYVNYFDGIYTGRDFEDNDTAQATVTMAQVMTNEKWSENQAELIALYNLQREVMMANRYISTNAAGAVVSNVKLTMETVGNGKRFTYTSTRTKDPGTWSFDHDPASIVQSGQNIVVTYPHGRLQIQRDENDKVLSIKLLNTDTTGASAGFMERYDHYMTSAERTAFMKYLEEYNAYTDFVYSTYLDTSNSTAIKSLADEIKKQAHTEVQYKEEVFVPADPDIEGDEDYTYYKNVWKNEPADVSLAALRNAGSVEAHVQRDLLVRNVIDYIIYEMGCEYTITPDLSKVNEALDGVENFLYNTKEGYCVQFASASALILREMGIPTRYVEGYIASNLTKKSFGSDMSYGGYVKDYEAHAWIEVYFDGVGWVQYETTPEYYSGMYGIKSDDTVIPSTPKPPIETEKPDDPKDPVKPDETDTEEETTDDLGIDVEDNSGVMRATLIGLGVMVGIGLVIAVVGAIISGARRAEERRQTVVSQVLEDGFGAHVSDRDRQEMAFSMADSVSVLLKLFDLAPQPGEFREEYADRLTAALNRPNTRKKQREKEAGVVLPDMHLVLNAMAAEEFGHGMTLQEMKMMATFYLYLRREIKYRLPLMTRFYLRFVKRLI